MGAGIAQIAATAGKKVLLCDVKESAVQNGLSIIQKSLARIASKRPELTTEQETKAWVDSVMSRIGTTTDSEEGVKEADLVVEAIIENMKIKQDLFAFLDSKAPASCIFASNTSSLSISEIASAVSKERQAKFAGLHFFNPVPAMKLVEIISTPQTAPETTSALFEICEQMGKTPVTCKDTPGFIVNRLLVPYMLEAIRMVERGEATPKDIDTAMKLGAGYPMGPFSLLDYIGVDTTSYIADGWRQKPDQIAPAFVEEIPLMTSMIKEGKLGKKTPDKGGFWQYDAKGKQIVEESK